MTKPKKKAAADFVTVDCCYCMTTQQAPEPPVLVDCTKCGRSFRVFRPRDPDTKKIELTKSAQKFFSGGKVA